jgi:hypothetical protein
VLPRVLPRIGSRFFLWVVVAPSVLNRWRAAGLTATHELGASVARLGGARHNSLSPGRAERGAWTGHVQKRIKPEASSHWDGVDQRPWAWVFGLDPVVSAGTAACSAGGGPL